MKTVTFVCATCLGLMLGSASVAQSSGIPKEFPPADFRGNQYIDSDGCAFIRAGISGNISWVPRVDRQRRQLCNFQPTFAPEPEPVPEPVEAPVVAEAVPDEPAVVDAPTTAAAAIAAAPAPLAPIAPVVAAPVETPVAAPAPRPVPATPEVVAPVAPASMTLAEACNGRSGIQEGFVSATTGDPIDCGPAPAVMEAVVPTPAADPIPRMTLAEICAEAALTGTRFVNHVTGEPIVCETPMAPVVASAPAVSEPAMPSADVTTMETQFVTTCGGVAIHRRANSNVRIACGQDGAAATARAGVPASNPPVGTPVSGTRPSGYQQVWTDDRLNPERGLPQTASRVSTRSSVPAVAPQLTQRYRYVQVGSFADHANAQRLGERMIGMGLPVSTARRGALKIVLAGPFNDPTAAQQALSAARSMGFTDAYLRN